MTKPARIWEADRPDGTPATAEDVLTALEALRDGAKTEEEREEWAEVARLQREDMRR